MRRFVATVVVALALARAPAGAAPARPTGGGIRESALRAVTIQASPNPATVGQKVTHTLAISTTGSLRIWVSAVGFRQPGSGTLPPGTWVTTCCPSEAGGTSAWLYRSTSSVPPGTYRFGAVAKAPGTYLSTAQVGLAKAGVWIRVA
ncbi:MAG TPA: hypothetical protein VFC04_00270 [Actinomycetota bacterium]|nr:hypothetical protein [Actinomycetota bacterium]